MTGLYGLSSYAHMFRTGSSYSNMFGSGSSSTSSFYSNLGEYSSIRNGAYRKLVKSYYKKMNSTDSDTTDKSTTGSIRKNTKLNSTGTVALSTVKSEASDLVASTKKLTATGKDSLFASEEKYDAEAAYKAVGNFVTQYNDTVDALSKVSSTAVKNAGNHMQNMTNIMSKGLSKVGIAVGTDGKLTVDEQKFKAADMSKVKALFDGSSSYAGVVSSAAGRIASQAGNQISQLGGGLYGSNGYYNSYYSGSLYNGYF